jgi:hypothetical protein
MQDYSATALSLRQPPVVDGLLDQDLKRLQSQIDSGGIMAALRSLNARVAHRFSAVYRLERNVHRAVFVYDKLGHALDPRFRAIPRQESFCQFITASKPFSVSDSATERLLSAHKYRGVLGAYYGVLLSKGEGEPVGSLCHFDFDARAQPSAQECIFLNRATTLLLTRHNGF